MRHRIIGQDCLYYLWIRIDLSVVLPLSAEVEDAYWNISHTGSAAKACDC